MSLSRRFLSKTHCAARAFHPRQELDGGAAAARRVATLGTKQRVFGRGGGGEQRRARAAHSRCHRRRGLYGTERPHDDVRVDVAEMIERLDRSNDIEMPTEALGLAQLDRALAAESHRTGHQRVTDIERQVERDCEHQPALLHIRSVPATRRRASHHGVRIATPRRGRRARASTAYPTIPEMSEPVRTPIFAGVSVSLCSKASVAMKSDIVKPMPQSSDTP